MKDLEREFKKVQVGFIIVAILASIGAALLAVSIIMNIILAAGG